MLPDGIADAALLAAEAPAGGRLSPRDEGVELAYLDLRADQPAVARSRLAAVARAFGPRLQVQEGLRLLAATGDLSPAEAASLFARSAFGGAGEVGPQIGAIRGENVLDQLETLIASGGRYYDREGPRSLAEETRPIAAAWAHAPRQVVQATLQAGATVVISRSAMPQALAPDGGEDGASVVSLQLIDSYQLIATVRYPERLKILPADLATAVTIDSNKAATHLTVSASRYEEAVEIAQRLELAEVSGSYDVPLVGLITPRFTPAFIEVPPGLLEFGTDLRAAKDWFS